MASRSRFRMRDGGGESLGSTFLLCAATTRMSFSIGAWAVVGFLSDSKSSFCLLPRRYSAFLQLRAGFRGKDSYMMIFGEFKPTAARGLCG